MRHLCWSIILVVAAGCSDGAVPPESEAGVLVDGTASAEPQTAVDARPGGEARAGDGPGTSACAAGPALLAKVSQARLLAEHQALAGLGERTSAAGQAKTALHLQGLLATLGLPLRAQSYTYKTATFTNLEVTIPGELSDRFVFVGAHYDAFSGSPGADDDGSGTVAVLELARALAGCKPKRTIRLLLFSNEEVGTIGSTHYVQSIKGEVPPASLLGFLSLDMIGYARPGEDLDVVTRPAYAALAGDAHAAMTKWTTLPVRKVISEACG